MLSKCFCNLLIPIFFLLIFDRFCIAEDALGKTVEVENKVKVYIPGSSEEESLELRGYQLATIKVYLATLGDMVDKFMVSLLDLGTNKVISSQLSDLDGVVVFRKIPPGSYHLYLNKKLKEDGEFSNVSIADVVLSKY